MNENKQLIYIDKIFGGDAAVVLQSFPEQFVDCVVTSPPYFKQRDYGHQLQIGVEKEPEKYIARLLEVFDQCYRVLKNSGTFWLNLGDKYQEGRLLGMPWRVALALQERGWFLRSDIIWQKANAMPSSVKNRPTTDHEYIFLFTKSNEYYYDADSIREPHVTFTEQSKMKGGRNHFTKRNGTPEKGKNQGNSNLHDGRWDQAFHPKGRNKRTVWSVPLSKYRGAHFAVFPEKLIEPCILAGSPKHGLVLDPFFGAGTTGIVASTHNRHYIGIELNQDYLKLAEERLSVCEPLLF
jgi:site-specific DNA-methyltransferase (adenine-specific)